MNIDKIAVAQEFVLNIRGTTYKLTKEEARFLRDELDAMLDDRPKIPAFPVYRGPVTPYTPPPERNPFSPFTPVDPRGPTCAVPTDAEVTNAYNSR